MNQPVIFFDDICVLCTRSVRFILRNDPRARFRFAAVGSETYLTVVQQADPDGAGKQDSMVLYLHGNLYTKSSAALRIAGLLRFPWPVFYIFLLVPGCIRNALYDLIARHRYSWFGKRNQCYLPNPAIKDRFLD